MVEGEADAKHADGDDDSSAHRPNSAASCERETMGMIWVAPVSHVRRVPAPLGAGVGRALAAKRPGAPFVLADVASPAFC